MNKKMRKSLIFAIVSCIASGLNPMQARAEFIVEIMDAVDQQAAGIWKYTYMVTNASDDNERLFTLDVLFGVGVAISEIAMPAGWEVFYNDGDSAVSWFSTTPDTDILPGRTLTLTFLANGPPASYFATAEGEDRGGEILRASLPIQAPSAVPEPSATTLVLIGAMVVILHCLSQRRRPRSAAITCAQEEERFGGAAKNLSWEATC